MPRFYLPPENFSATPMVLEGDEAHHLTTVLHGKAGTRVTVFDGVGTECHCAVAATSKKSVVLHVVHRTRTVPLPYTITLAQALPKGQAMDTIIQKATELGARVIQPLVSERSIPQGKAKESKSERWRQISIEAAKQCGVNWLPDILPLKTAADFLRTPLRHNLKLIGSLQPGAQSLRRILADEPLPSLSPTALLLIGPEGDFTPGELAAAKTAGCQPLSLGPLILRCETAAVAALSILAYELNESCKK